MRMAAIAGALMSVALGGHAALAQEQRCEDLRLAVGLAGFEWEPLRGDPIDVDSGGEFSAVASRLQIDGAQACAIFTYNQDGRAVAANLDCFNVGPNTPETVASWKADLDSCLDVRGWRTQPGESGDRPHLAPYGLFQIMLRESEEQVDFVVMTARDENGETFGSPFRGDRTLPNGQQLCVPRPPDEVFGLFAGLANQAGAEPFETDEVIGVNNTRTNPVNIFVTRPPHPAHPALIARYLVFQGGQPGLQTGADFSGDCQAFQALFEEALRADAAAARSSGLE